MQSVKNKIISLPPYNLRDDIFQEKTKFFLEIQAAYEKADQRGIASLKNISKDQGYLFGKELPHDISHVVPHVLS